jgi:hypothetical protein
MIEFLQQYGSYLSAIVVILFQIIKAIINNKKMDKKFDNVTDKKVVQKEVEKIDYKKLADCVLDKLDERAKQEIK